MLMFSLTFLTNSFMQFKCPLIEIANSNHCCREGIDPLDTKIKLGFDMITITTIGVEITTSGLARQSKVSMAKSHEALFHAAYRVPASTENSRQLTNCEDEIQPKK